MGEKQMRENKEGKMKKRNFTNGMLAVAIVSMLSGMGCKEEKAVETVKQAKEIPVRIATIENKLFEDRIYVQGTLESKYFANVSARVSGTIQEMPVDKGDAVAAGKTKLFTIDKENRERELLKSRQAVAVAEQNLNVAKANVEKIRVELKKAELDKNRYERLHENGTATDNELELYTTQYAQACAGMKYAEATEGAVAEQLTSARIACQIAEKDLADCTVYAPISGVVSQRYKELGEQGSSGSTIIRIEGTDEIEAVAFVSAQYYSKIAVGKTKMRVNLNGQPAGEYTITYKSPVIDPTLRTFEIKTVMTGNMNTGVVAGAMADITVIMDSHEGLAVPTHSLLTRRLGQMVYLAKDGKAVPCYLTSGLENEGMTEIKALEGGQNITAGDVVLAEGQYLVSDNDAIKIQE